MATRATLAELVRERLGIVLRPAQSDLLHEALRVSAGGDGAVADLLGTGLRSPAWRRVISSVTNGHTSFFRHRDQLTEVGARLDSARQPVWIWSCGCSSGEEPYTLAMMGLERGVDVRVLGTDVNEAALEAARRGRYRGLTLGKLPQRTRARFFAEDGEDLVVGPDVRRSVDFGFHNLHESHPPLSGAPDGRWDLVLCRNVLIYFDEGSVRRAWNRLASSLASDGELVLGHTDALCVSIAGGGGEAIPSRARVVHLATTPPPARVMPERASAPPVTWSSVLMDGHEALIRHAFDEALQAYEAAHDLAPLEAEVHLGFGLLQRRIGDLDHAHEALRRAAFLAPRSWVVSFHLASVLQRRGRRRRSRLEHERALELIGDQNGPPPLESYAPHLEELFPPAERVAEACRLYLSR